MVQRLAAEQCYVIMLSKEKEMTSTLHQLSIIVLLQFIACLISVRNSKLNISRISETWKIVVFFLPKMNILNGIE